MNCREVIEFLHDYSAGDLLPETLAVFREHVGKCPPCLAYLDCYEQTVKLCRGACHEAPAEVPEDLILAILSVRPASGFVKIFSVFPISTSSPSSMKTVESDSSAWVIPS